MKLCFLAIFLFISLQTIAQNNSTYSFQGALAINLTNVHDNNTNNALGYGAAFNLVIPVVQSGYLKLGTEYNRINLVKHHVSESPVSNSEDVSYAFQYLALPVSFGVALGKNILPFLEVGGFIDVPVAASRTGTGTTIYPVYVMYEFSGTTVLPKTNYGPMFTLGVKIPIKEINLIISTTYKNGQMEYYGYRTNVAFDRYFRLAIGLEWK